MNEKGSLMNSRKYYIDNLRWAFILLLVPFHSAMAWNSWGEGNYIWFHANRGYSSFVTFVSPWYMSLLFVVAGVSARYSMQKRNYGQFLKERVAKLLVPLTIGMLTVIPIMTYYADQFHNAFDGSFLSHYKVFFTKFTTLTGYDGGWTPGHLWFLLYLFIISILCVGAIALQKKYLPNLECKNMSMGAIMAMGIIPTLMYPVLNIAGKSIGSYFVLFLIGYYLIYENEIMGKITKYRFINLMIMIAAGIGNIYLFLWIEDTNEIMNAIVMFVACWFGVLTILGFGQCLFNQNNKVTRYLSSRSFPFYIFHFGWLVLFQFYLSRFVQNTTVLFLLPIVGTYLMTIITAEFMIRVPYLNRLFGSKR
jgi:hypothetical protein